MIHDIVLKSLYEGVRKEKETIMNTLLTKRFRDLSEVARLQGEYQGLESAVAILEQAADEYDV